MPTYALIMKIKSNNIISSMVISAMKLNFALNTLNMEDANHVNQDIT